MSQDIGGMHDPIEQPQPQPRRASSESVNYGAVNSGSGQQYVGNVASGPGATLNVYGTTSFQEAATNLAQGVAPVHPEAAESLRWIGSHANADREPPDAQKHLNVVKAAAGWVWEGFIAIVNAGGSAIAPWLVSLIRNIGH